MRHPLFSFVVVFGTLAFAHYARAVDETAAPPDPAELVRKVQADEQ